MLRSWLGGDRRCSIRTVSFANNRSREADIRTVCFAMSSNGSHVNHFSGPAVTSPVTEPVAAPVGKRVAPDCEAADRALKRARRALVLAEFDAADAKEEKERQAAKKAERQALLDADEKECEMWLLTICALSV
jgi:hypothetical protein